MRVDLLGRPFAPGGRGASLRSSFRALREVGVEPRVIDVGGLLGGDLEIEREMAAHLADVAVGDVQIFFIDGDEVRPVLERLSRPLRERSYTIIQPLWEWAAYLHRWTNEIESFDEVWVASNFIRDAVSGMVRRPVLTLPPPISVRIRSPLGRRYFGIPESSYAFMSAFDLRSGTERTNPAAVLDVFRRVVEARPLLDVVLVLRVDGTVERPEDYDDFRRLIATTMPQSGAGRIVILPNDMSDIEVENLLWCSDCFISLHRSDEFGRRLAQAMLLEKPVIATAYSGNLDFMTPDTACLVPCEMSPVPADAFSFLDGEVWAEPDLDQAVEYMLRMLDEPRHGRELGARAGRYVRTTLSYRAVGLQYRERLGTVLTGPRSPRQRGLGGAQGAPSAMDASE
jgi:glycosyltransferase involved in cell wall biosynthesis